MRLIFAGTPEFAAASLRRLHASGFELVLVVTQPDRPAGRGMKPNPSAVKVFAVEYGLPLIQPRSLRLDGKYSADALAAQQAISCAQPDAIVVAAYGLILPQWVLDIPRLGCINIHASMLPRWRGAAPVQRAIEAGDTQTGITLMQMDAGLDTGNLLLTRAVEIADNDTTATLSDRLSELGSHLIVDALCDIGKMGLCPQPQPRVGTTYAHKIEKTEAEVDWTQSASQIERRIRAFDPSPGVRCGVDGEAVKIWRGRVVSGQGAPGEVLAVNNDGIVVACGEASLQLTELQRPGGKRVPAAQFLHNRKVTPGTRLG